MLTAYYLLIVICIAHMHSSLALQTLKGILVKSISTKENVDLGETVVGSGSSLLVLGTYAADFNAIEYAQRLRYYLPQLKEKGVRDFYMVMNASPDAAKELAVALDLPAEVQIFSDPLGVAGRAFGVSLGYMPDDALINPYLKLFVMLWGIGAWATLPSVIGGYIGNPWSKQPWIQAALAQGQLAGRWPNTALEIEEGTVKKNKFDELPYVGGWGRRPLELATLRLQNMIGVSLKQWDKLKPSEEALSVGVLTQLGGCVLLKDGEVKFEWRDQGICHVANFEEMLRKL